MVRYFALAIHSFLGEVKMYSKEELVLKIIFRGSSVIFKNYDYPAVMLSFGVKVGQRYGISIIT